MDDLVSKKEVVAALTEFYHLRTDIQQHTLLTALARVGVTRSPSSGRWEKPPWTPKHSYKFVCSECGETAYYVHGVNNSTQRRKPFCGYRFCPNCGAAMETSDDQ